MNGENQYILKWKEHVLKAADALRNNEFETYDAEMAEMEQAYEEYKKENQLSYFNESSFGSANAIFESALPQLYKTNQKVIKEVIKTIKEDKNLHAQFMFLEALKKYNKEYDLKEYVNNAFTLAKSHINPKTLNESNQKLYSVLRKHNIKASELLDEDKLKFYNDCDSLFKTNLSLNNLGTINTNFNKVMNFVNEQANKVKSEEIKVKTLKEFADKYNATLTDSEKEILNTLLDTNNENKRKKMFEAKKKECMNRIKKLIEESEGSDKVRLNTLYENISSKIYDKNTVIEEVLKMLEVFDVFED